MLQVPYLQLNGKNLKTGIQTGALQKISNLARKLGTSRPESTSLKKEERDFILNMRKMMDEISHGSQMLCSGVHNEDNLIESTAKSKFGFYSRTTNSF